MSSIVEEESASELVTVPAVDRTFAILELISDSAKGLSLSEISKQLRLPKNAVFRITNTLRARGYLTRDETSLHFTLTSRFLRFARQQPNTKNLMELSRDVMRELRDQTGETVQIGKRICTIGVILDHVESLHPLRISVDAGLQFPLHNNAPGKLLLAYTDRDAQASLLSQIELVRSTERTITDRKVLLQECQTIRDRGYSTDCAEADEGIHCVAAPLFRAGQEVTEAIWISAPSRRLPKSTFSRFGAMVQQAAARISHRLQNEGG